MKLSRRAYSRVITVVVGIVIATTLVIGLVKAAERSEHPKTQSETGAIYSTATKYVGMWVTLDGTIRHELLPNGRYDEARGSRKSAYQGRYEIRGTHIDYWDDTGFTADGTFVSDDELHHGGMIFRRER